MFLGIKRWQPGNWDWKQHRLAALLNPSLAMNQYLQGSYCLIPVKSQTSTALINLEPYHYWEVFITRTTWEPHNNDPHPRNGIVHFVRPWRELVSAPQPPLFSHGRFPCFVSRAWDFFKQLTLMTAFEHQRRKRAVDEDAKLICLLHAGLSCWSR